MPYLNEVFVWLFWVLKKIWNVFFEQFILIYNVIWPYSTPFSSSKSPWVPPNHTVLQLYNGKRLFDFYSKTGLANIHVDNLWTPIPFSFTDKQLKFCSLYLYTLVNKKFEIINSEVSIDWLIRAWDCVETETKLPLIIIISGPLTVIAHSFIWPNIPLTIR